MKRINKEIVTHLLHALRLTRYVSNKIYIWGNIQLEILPAREFVVTVYQPRVR